MNLEIGQIFKIAYNVTAEVYSSFQICSKDFNPLHTDEDFAHDKGFTNIVMYGNILNAFISNFIGECLPIKNVIIHSQSIAFKNPVYMNERLIFNAMITDIFDSVNTVEFKYKFIKSNDKIAAKGLIQIGVLL